MKGRMFATKNVGMVLTTLLRSPWAIHFTHVVIKKTCSSNMAHRSPPTSCRIWTITISFMNALAQSLG